MIAYGSLFSGAGLLDYGLHSVLPDLAPSFAVEINEDRRSMFGAHFPGATLLGDIETLDPKTLPAVEGLIGGVPCNTHSSSNTAGARGLAPQWSHVKRIIRHTSPIWSLWESSGKDGTWKRWVPPVRRDLWTLGHASLSFRVRTRHRGAPHDRERAFVISWSKVSHAHRNGQPARAIHAEASRLRSAPVDLWDGRVPACAHGRMDDGVDLRLAEAIGYGVDQRTAEDAGRVLGALIDALARARKEQPAAPTG